MSNDKFYSCSCSTGYGGKYHPSEVMNNFLKEHPDTVIVDYKIIYVDSGSTPFNLFLTFRYREVRKVTTHTKCSGDFSITVGDPNSTLSKVGAKGK